MGEFVSGAHSGTVVSNHRSSLIPHRQRLQSPRPGGGDLDYVRLGDSAVEVSRICLGTSTFGTEGDDGTGATDRETSHEDLEEARDRGLPTRESHRALTRGYPLTRSRTGGCPRFHTPDTRRFPPRPSCHSGHTPGRRSAPCPRTPARRPYVTPRPSQWVAGAL